MSSLSRFVPMGALVVGLVGCSNAAPMQLDGTDAAGRPYFRAFTDLQQLADELCHEVSQAVGLDFVTRVEAIEQPRATLFAALEASFRKQYKMAAETPLEPDVRRALELTQEVLAGYYDPEDRHRLRVLDDINPSDRIDIMRHELMHALQDQYWPLAASHVATEALGSDAMAARRAVVEGQAMVAMAGPLVVGPWTPAAPSTGHGVVFGDKMPVNQAELLRRSRRLRAGASISMTPPPATLHGELDLTPTAGDTFGAAMNEAEALQMYFPYVYGQYFIETVRGEQSLQHAVVATFARMPTTTHEILHPEVWLAGEKTPVLELAALKEVPDYAYASDDTFGELASLQLLGTDAEGAGLAAAWRADRLLKHTNAAGPGIVLVTLWADEAAAAQVLALAHKKQAEAAAGDASQDAPEGHSELQLLREGPFTAVLSQSGGINAALVQAAQRDLARLWAAQQQGTL